MSNASNLSTLANVLDDGSSGQFLKSTGSGGVAFDTVAAGAVVYATADLLPLSGFAAGDMAYVTATNRFYINNGSGWYSISLVNTNPNITSVQDAGSNTTPFTLATDQTATVITITAADPEDVPLTYGYSVTSGSLNGSTVAQGTGSNTNVFTVTPHASQDATFTLTFTASDGINQATSANVFSLSFITIVTDSNHTTLLATATSTGANSTIEDSSTANSGSGHNISVNGDAHAGTFSPYRSGGYSTYFDGTGDYLTATHTTPLGTADFTVEGWINFHNVGGNRTLITLDDSAQLYFRNSGSSIAIYGISGGTYNFSTGTPDINTWYHFAFVRQSGSITLYWDGQSKGSVGCTDNFNSGNLHIGCWSGISEFFQGHLTDIKISNTAVYTSNFSVPTERLSPDSSTKLITCHLPYIADGSNLAETIVVNGDPKTKPFSPYDYNEYSTTDHGGSVYFDGSGDYLTIPSSNDFQLGTTGTINFWMHIDTTGNAGIVSGYNNANSLFIYCQNNFNLEWRDNNNAYYSLTGITLSQKVWTYVSIVRSGTTLKVYLNGVEKASQTVSSTSEFGSDENLEIGNRSAIGWTYKGYLSDFQIIKGTAIVPTSSTIPIAPSATHSNSKLHLKGTDASIIDKSQVNNIVMNGPTTGSTTKSAFGSEPTISFASGSNSSRYLEFDPTVLNFMEILGDPSIPFTIEGIWGWQGSTAAPIFEIYQDSNNFFYFGAGRGGTTNGVTTSINCHGIFKVGGTEKFNLGGNTGSYNVVGSSFKHQAITRNSSGLIQHWYNGSASSNTATHSGSSTVSWSSPTGYIGGSQIMGSTYGRYEGYIHQIRLTVGKARYTTNFTAPTSSFEG